MAFLSRRTTKIISSVVLSFFLWTFGGLFDIAYAIRNDKKRAVTAQQQKDANSEEQFEKETDDIYRALTDPTTDSDTKKNKVKGEKARIDNLDAEIKKKLNDTEKKLRNDGVPAEILQRHRDFVKHYDDNLKELRKNLDDIDKAKNKGEADAAIERTKGVLERTKSPKKHIPLDPGSLPYRTAEPVFIEPKTNPAEFTGGLQEQSRPILVASSGSLKGLVSSSPAPNSTLYAAITTQATNPPTAADLAETIEVQFTPEIAAKAQELEHDPVKIYNWVRNNIEYVPSYGSIQGAGMCLQTKLCNDFDTASLLIALLRASAIHAKYVYGTIEVPIEKVRNWLGGFSSPMAAVSLLASAGIPAKAVVSAGEVKQVQMEHVWVESYIDYIPSRGSRHKTGEGDTWIRLDASFKQYKYTQGTDIKASVPFDSRSFTSGILATATINETEGYATGVDCQLTSQAMIDYEASVKAYLNQNRPGSTVGDILGAKRIVAQDFPYLLGTLPYKVVATGPKTSEVPDSFRHKAAFTLKSDANSADISIVKSLPEIAGHKITLSYSPATQVDADLINSYLPRPHADGSPVLFSELPATLPAYLVKLKPELRQDGVVIASGAATGLGQIETLGVTFIGPNLGAETASRNITAGEFAGIVIDTGRISEGNLLQYKAQIEASRAKLLQPLSTNLQKDALLGDIFSSAAQSYFAEMDKMNYVRAGTGGVVSIRLPSGILFSSKLNTAFLLGVPYTVSAGGLAADVLRKVGLVESLDGNRDKRLRFAFTSGLDSSTLAQLVEEGLFSTPGSTAEGMSAVKALGLAKKQGTPVYTIDQGNVNTIVPKLQLNDDIVTDIRNAVNAGKIVVAPKTGVTSNGWSGFGYVVIDPATGDSAYMITGDVNGGLLQGLPWIANSVISNLTPEISTSLQDLCLQMAAAALPAALGAIAAGVSDLPLMMATDYLSLFVSSYFYEAVDAGLGCYMQLSTPLPSLGSCMALYLGALCIAMESMAISSTNSRPVANAGPGQTVRVGDMVVLDGSGSFDPNNYPLAYQWSFVSMPGGSSVTLSSVSAVRPTFIADKAGTYVAQLVVQNGKAYSDPSMVTIGTVLEMASVPDVVGMALPDVETTLLASGLVLGNVTTASSTTVPLGKVISQNPAASSVVYGGSAVDVVISRGTSVDTEAPVLSARLDRTPPVYALGDTVNVNISATDNSGQVTVTMTLDGANTPLTLPVTSISTAGLAAGSTHTLVVRAADPSSNVSTVTLVFGIKDPGITTVPNAVILTPSDNSRITAPTDIVGTATDTNLLYYTLAYSPAGRNQFTTFAKRTTQVTNGTLGTLDPSLMKNGIYDVVLSVTDVNGLTVSTSMTYLISGDLKVGNFTVSFTDVNVPVAGMPVTVTRTYDSRDKSKGDFGYGWSINFQDVKIEENRTLGIGWQQYTYGEPFTTYCLDGGGSRFASIALPDGRTEEFDVSYNPNCQYLVPIQSVTPVFTPRPGTTSTLSPKKPVNLLFLGGLVLDMDTMEAYNPGGYVLTTFDGTAYDLDKGFGISKITDPNGNTLTYGSSGIVHSAGKSLTFTRDAQSRITMITDPGGRTVRYDYDPNGDLVAVTDQNGNISRYSYNSSHGLTDIVDPRGITAARNIYDDSGRLMAHIDSYGNRIEYTHNIAGRQEAVRDRNGNLTVFIYDDRGKVLSKTDSMGHTTTYTYDSNGNKLTETDPLGGTTTWTYDSKNNKLSETRSTGSGQATTLWSYNSLGKALTTTDPMGRVTTNTYDAKGNLLTTTDPMGNVTTSTYDTQGNLLTSKDGAGNTSTYEYNSYGYRTKKTDPRGNITTYTHDSNGNKLTEADPRGGVTRYTYDGTNRQTSVQDPLGNISRTEYDKAGNRAAEINALGLRTDFIYSSANKLIQTDYPDGTSTKVGYDAEGNRTSSTDQMGRTTTYTYDPSKQLTGITYPDGATQGYGYDAAGMQTTATDALGNTTTKVYDGIGRVIQSIDPQGNATSFTYDLNGNQITQTDANGHTTTFVYDANNRQTQTILQGGQTTTVGYDGMGRKASETDAANNTTRFGYDGNGNLTSVTDALNNITGYEYDGNNNRTAIVDARGNRTNFVYDLANRLSSKTMPNGGIETYSYDPAGRQLTRTDAKDQMVQHAYDPMGRLLSRSYPDNSSVHFTYSLAGKRGTATDKRGLTNYTYDNRNRLTQMTYPDGQAITYTYNLRGNIQTITSLAGKVTYTYSSCCGRLESVTDPQGKVTTYGYDPAGNRTGLLYPNGTNVSYTYDNNNRLTNLTHKNSVQQVIASYAYTLGAIGNRTRVDENTGIIRSYTYDNLYRLTKEQVADPSGTQTYQNDYSYDAVGNRQTKNTNSYTYNNADQLVTESGITYEYDLSGNLSKKTDTAGITTYTYDYDNKLVKVVTPASTVSYVYDVDGNRVEQASNATTTRYLVDTNRQLAQVLAEYAPTGNLLAYYVYADDLISMTRNAQTSYYHFDGLGSTRLLTNALGAVTDTYSYDAFGNLIAKTGTTQNPFLFTGQQYEANIGFYYLRARYYQPTVGRFSALDPFEGDPYAPMSLHRYLYAADDPVNKVDPSGEFFGIGEILTVISIIDILSKGVSPNLAGVVRRSKVQICRRDLNIDYSMIASALRFRYYIFYHSFITVSNSQPWDFDTYGFTTKSKKILSSPCIIEGPGTVDRNDPKDVGVVINPGFMHGSCENVPCRNPKGLLDAMELEWKHRVSLDNYCLNPFGSGGINCQEWAYMKLRQYCY